MRDDTKRSNRRSFLRMIGGGLATGAAAAAAGCFGTLPPLGGDIDFGRVDPPSSPDATYREWIPEPTAFDGVTADDAPETYPRVVRPGAFPGGPAGSTVHANHAAPTKVRLDHFGIGWTTYRTVVDYFGGTGEADVLLVDAAFDVDTVADTLTGSGYERVDALDDVRTFERTDPARTVAVAESTLVYATGTRARGDVRTVLDAARGRVPRYDAVNEDFGRLSERVGASALTTFQDSALGTADELDARRTARSVRPTANAVYTVDALAFPDGATPTTDRIERAYAHRAAEDAVSMEVGVDDDLGIVEQRLSSDAFLKARQQRDGGRITWPQATWSATYDRGAETVTFTHRGGESVEADNTNAILYQDGPDSPRTAQFPDDTDTITRGDSLTVDVDDREAGDVLALGYVVYGIGGRNMVDVRFGEDA